MGTDINIEALIDSDCDKCHGRGYSGFFVIGKSRTPIICPCVRVNYRKQDRSIKADGNLMRIIAMANRRVKIEKIKAMIKTRPTWWQKAIDWLLLNVPLARYLYNPGMKYARPSR